jgi:MGT family glycosyltransferase
MRSEPTHGASQIGIPSMTGRSAVVFCMPEQGHFKRLLPLISGLAGAGLTTHVFTDLRYREAVERAGGRFADVFAGRPLEAADAKSLPVPCRYVSFAAHYAESVLSEVAALRPALVVHDTFAVIGVVVATHLKLPRVAVCSGHNAAPGPTLEALRRDPRANVSDECWRAVALLRERHGMPDASPYSYATGLSSDLNVYCEPPEFLRPDEREAFEPIAFFGSLAAGAPGEEATAESLFGEDSGHKLRVYASFGTVVWRYYEAAVLAALEAVADAVASLDSAVAIVSLGGRGTPEHAALLTRRSVRVEPYVEQLRVLREASVFVTHHGLNSTHEAIYQRTPMISYPFFGDQPGLAKRCQELGLAIPLADAPRAPVSPEAVRSAFARIASQRTAIQARFETARGWELAAIRARGAVIQRIAALMDSGIR